MIWIDVKYAKMLSTHLRNFKQKSAFLFNGSCPWCGDSQTNKRKARLYIFRGGDNLVAKCHNCDNSSTLSQLLEFVDPQLRKEYAFEKFKEKNDREPPPPPSNNTIPQIFDLCVDQILDCLSRLDDLPQNHIAVKFCNERKIPRIKYNLLYYTANFQQFTNTVIPNKFPNPKENDHRLVIPYFNSHGKCIAFQGRTLIDQEPKYYTVKVDDNCERIFGLERVDYSKHILFVEGPLDSLFLPNGLAVSGSSFFTPTVTALKNHSTLIFDREPRSPEITSIIRKAIKQGFSVCLMPDTLNGKDINDYIVNGSTIDDVMALIKGNTFSGARAELEFARWKKIN